MTEVEFLPAWYRRKCRLPFRLAAAAGAVAVVALAAAAVIRLLI